jgi:hypothetical protein
VEAGPDFEQAGDAAANAGAALGRLCDATQELEQGRFSGAISADDSERLATLDLEGYVPKRPKILVSRGTVARRAVTPPLASMGDSVSLTERLGSYNYIGHSIFFR